MKIKLVSSITIDSNRSFPLLEADLATRGEQKKSGCDVGREIATFHFRAPDGKLDVNVALGGCNLTVTQRFA